MEIYPGFAAVDAIIGTGGEVQGIVTGDMGVSKDGHHKPGYTPGMALKAKYTFIAEGAHGSLAKKLIAKFKLREGREPPKFGIGLKELWELPKGKHQRGLVIHTMGWPLDNGTGGGSFFYHFGDKIGRAHV